jgi:putative tryptophan/tyrosine transport system substrate-binding protein
LFSLSTAGLDTNSALRYLVPAPVVAARWILDDSLQEEGMRSSLVRAIGICSALLVAVAGCGGGTSSGGGQKQYKIGAFALVPFTQIQDMLTGFKKGLNGCGLVEGQNTTYFIDFAMGQQPTLQVLAKKYIDQKVDAILSMDTPSMVTAASLTKTVPIIEVAATYPQRSGVIKSLDHPGTNVTGGTDYVDPKVTMDAVSGVLPNVKTIGIVYNPSEQNSAEFENAIKPVLSARNIKAVEVSVTGTSEVEAATRSLVGRVDAILLGPDNTAIAAAATVAQVAKQNKIPFVSYVSGVASKGALLDLGVDYLVLGQQAGQKACDVIVHKKNPADIPITGVPQPTLTVNTTTAQAIGVTIPPSVLSQAQTVTG